MMLPISQAVLEQLSATEADSDEKELREGQVNQAFELTEVNIKQPLDNTQAEKPNSMLFCHLKHLPTVIVKVCKECIEYQISLCYVIL